MQRSSLYSTGRQDIVVLTGMASIHRREPGSSHRGCVHVVFMGHSPPLAGRQKGRRVPTGPPLSKGFSFKDSHPRRELPMWLGRDFSITLPRHQSPVVSVGESGSPPLALQVFPG